MSTPEGGAEPPKDAASSASSADSAEVEPWWALTHPWMFASLPLLVLLVGNRHVITASDGGRVWLIVLAVATVVYGLAALVLRGASRGALVASPFLYMSQNFAPLVSSVSMLTGATVAGGLERGIALGIVLAVSPALLVPGRSAARRCRLNQGLTVVGGGLLLLQTPMLLFAGVQSGAFPRPLRFPALTTRAAQSETRPHVVICIVDGMGRADLYRELYDLDLSAEVAGFEALGFEVADEAWSDYPLTSVAVPSMFNMQRVERLKEAVEGPEPTSLELANTVVHSELSRLLRPLGYRTVHVDGGVEHFARGGFDETLGPTAERRMTELDRLVIMRSLPGQLGLVSSGRLGEVIDPFAYHRRCVRYGFSRLPELLRSETPTLAFCHILTPHAPFLFNADGTATDEFLGLSSQGTPFAEGSELHDNDPERQALYREACRRQAAFALRRALEASREALQSAARPAILLVTGDHGPGCWHDHTKPDRTLHRERFAIFHALHMPAGRRFALPERTTPIGTLRRAMNAGFGLDLPEAEVRMTYVPIGRPFAATDVTERIAREVRMGATEPLSEPAPEDREGR